MLVRVALSFAIISLVGCMITPPKINEGCNVGVNLNVSNELTLPEEIDTNQIVIDVSEVYEAEGEAPINLTIVKAYFSHVRYTVTSNVVLELNHADGRTSYYRSARSESLLTGSISEHQSAITDTVLEAIYKATKQNTHLCNA